VSGGLLLGLLKFLLGAASVGAAFFALPHPKMVVFCTGLYFWAFVEDALSMKIRWNDDSVCL
jgi:hypothetical protein